MNKFLTFFLASALSLSSFAQVVTVTNTNNIGAGSLRQAILDANANVSIDTVKFNIPTSDPNYNASTGVFTITVTGDSLPVINNNVLVIDGYSQRKFTSNSNTQQFGTGGTVGIDGLTLDKVDGPEIEIRDGGQFIWGLHFSSDYATVRGIAISSFGRDWNTYNGNLVFRFANHATIEGCVIGSRAHNTLAPTTNDNGGNNFVFFGADNATVHHNFVAFSDAMGGYFSYSCEDMLVYNNEFNGNARELFYTDGLDIAYDTENGHVYGNLFTNNGGNGFDTYTAIGNHLFENNTVTFNGKAQIESAGVRVYGAGNTYRKNIITSNFGAGIMVTAGATNMVISENSMYNNGNIMPNPQPWPTTNSNQIGIDLLNSGDDFGRGTSPFYTVNDNGDVDAGGNDLLNFPVIESALKQGGNLVISGYAPAGAKIEFFKGDLFSGAVYPQGKTFLFAKTEGSADDADASTGSYGPANINGAPQGQESGVNRFSFTVPMPAGLSLGDILTATATVTGVGTSEFGGRVSVSQPSLFPVLNCVYVKGNGDYVATFGYVNNTGSTITQAIGAQNQFSPAPQDRGQGTSFAAGTHNNVVSVTFSSGSVSWTLGSQTVTANSASARCDADLAVTQVVSNNAPTSGSNVTFTITLTNNSTDIPASGIQLGYVLDPNFVYVSNSPASGSYVHNGGGSNDGVWSIPELLPGASTTIDIVVTINGDGNAVATVNTQNQVDNNPTNNSATENITTSGSSGGNGGGVESNGSLAEKIAFRNFTRLKEGRTEAAFYANLDQLTTLAQHQRSAAGKTSALSDYIPASIPQSTQSLVTSPTDLIGITNATNIFAADYFNAANNRLGVVLTMETLNSVYEHTKIVCDRLRGGRLEEISTIQVAGHPFRMVKLLQENGSIDYAISFVVFQDAAGNFKVDQKWNLNEYVIPASSKIYNFQVWTISPSLTTAATEEIFNLFRQDGSVSFMNKTAPTIPSVYVVSGEYSGGKLHLLLNNQIGAAQISINANKSATESSASRQDVHTTATIPMTNASPTVDVNIGYIFDVDFTLTNNQGGGTDMLYFADGPWGKDADPSGVINGVLNVTAETDAHADPNTLFQERDIVFSGSIITYASIYKQLRAGARTKDLSAFNQLKFELAATGIQTVEVTVVKEGISLWNQQFRTNIVADGTLKTYTIDFVDLVSSTGQTFTAEDVVAVNFALKNGTSGNSIPTTLDIKNVQFNKNGKIGLDENGLANAHSFRIEPNPFVESTFFTFELAQREKIALEVYDLSGKLVATQAAETYEAGSNRIKFTANGNMKGGVYIVKLISDTQTRTERMIMAR
jgi:uncharacterized repeat protein (TIGR01451 family)